MRTAVWVLGDQLTLRHSGLQATHEGRPVVLMIESLSRAKQRQWHGQKLVLVWSAMRHFAKCLRARGYQVDYYEQQPSYAAALRDYLRRRQPDRLCLMQTAEHGASEDLARLATGLGAKVVVLASTMFLSEREAFRNWAQKRKQLRMEPFYRDMRRRTGLLMLDDEPVGGQWNLDKENRRRAPDGYRFPPISACEPDDTTQAVMAIVRRDFPDAFGELGTFGWPVTREDAEWCFGQFLEERLDCFGPYQDAMVLKERALCHSLISTALNIGLLDPLNVCSAAVAQYESGAARLNSVEGFVRQVIGWREYVYQVYHLRMPDYATVNYLDADLPLPLFYWDGETKMRCVAEAVAMVRRYGHNHHIQRLMVTGNFALLAGICPQNVNAWYHATYVDAHDWVVTPNVLGMALYADGGLLASKPYAASANYIHKMSDSCERCRYDHRLTVGEPACPFNSLYWDFLSRNENKLRASGARVGLMLASLRRKDSGEIGAIRKRAASLRTQLANGGCL